MSVDSPPDAQSLPSILSNNDGQDQEMTSCESDVIDMATSDCQTEIDVFNSLTNVEDSYCHFWTLPEEVVLFILTFLPISSVCALMQTCKRLRNLGHSRYVQSKISFADSWPSKQTQAIYLRAANAGNFEASIKMGVACLYGEGITPCADLAESMLTNAQIASDAIQPFVWLLFRPPWSSSSCSKAAIFSGMKAKADELVKENGKRYCGLTFCVAKTLSLQFGVEDARLAEEWFHKAAQQGCGEAAYEIAKIAEKTCLDAGSRLELVRILRSYGQSGSLNVKLALCSEYIKGNFGSATECEAMYYFQGLLQQSACQRVVTAQQQDLDNDGRMRSILVDWLVEVADLKGFSRDTLYMTVSLVDRFLSKCPIKKTTLQLLGIACMVISARFIESEVITIREAAWLTDNTYKYEEVVRSIGQALHVTRGKLRVASHLDYLRLFFQLGSEDREMQNLMHLIAELSLLRISTETYAPSILAASVFYLARKAKGYRDEVCWPEKLQQWTMFTISDLAGCIMGISRSVFSEECILDHRGVEIKAMNNRYPVHIRQIADNLKVLSQSGLLALNVEGYNSNSSTVVSPDSPAHGSQVDSRHMSTPLSNITNAPKTSDKVTYPQRSDGTPTISGTFLYNHPEFRRQATRLSNSDAPITAPRSHLV